MAISRGCWQVGVFTAVSTSISARHLGSGREELRKERKQPFHSINTVTTNGRGRDRGELLQISIVVCCARVWISPVSPWNWCQQLRL